MLLLELTKFLFAVLCQQRDGKTVDFLREVFHNLHCESKHFTNYLTRLAPSCHIKLRPTAMYVAGSHCKVWFCVAVC